MPSVSVGQFVNHLPIAQRGAVLASREAMLEHLRGMWRTDPQAKRDLEGAAKGRAAGERFTVEALPEEREAARAVIYAVLRLARTMPKPEARRTMRVVQPKDARRMEAWYLELPGLGTVRLTRNDLYPKEVRKRAEELHSRGMRYFRNQYRAQNRERVERPELELAVDFEAEAVETSDTAHLEASVRETGWGWVLVDGEPVERTRWWASE